MDFAYRVETRLVKELDFPYNGQTVSKSQEVYNFTQRIHDMDVEKFVILFLNHANSLIGLKTWEGTTGAVPVLPREVLKLALLTGATGIVMVHNHPTNNLSPSIHDLDLAYEFKDRLKFFDVALLDFIIVGTNGYYSFIDNGNL